MKDFGARRISRAIIIDVHSVLLCSPEMLSKYRKIEGVDQALLKMKKLDDTAIDSLDNLPTKDLTNLGIFRAYIAWYIGQKNEVRQDLDVIIKQRGHLVTGLPVEVYCFANVTDTKTFENIQSDIFDHLMAITPLFDLKLYQAAAIAG